MTPQKITHVLMTADTVGGVWTYAMELIRGLGECGVLVSLAAMGEYLSPTQRAEAHSLPNLEVFERNCKLEWMQDPWEDVRMAGEWLLELEQRLRPDIIHLNGYVHGALPWRTPVLIVGHSCVASWWRGVYREECDARWAGYKDAVRRGLRACQCLVTPSRAMLEALYLEYGPIPAGRVIPNGRSGPMFVPGAKEPFILTAGRLWDLAKNVRLLDRAAGELAWPVKIAGEPKEPATEQVASFGRLEKLGYLPVEELADFYGRASIYAAPAKYEPFGLSILEAALSGCALVLGDIPSLREIWGPAALYVDPEDASDLAGKLTKLICSPSLLKKMAVRGQRHALRYTVRKMTAAYTQAYGQL